MSKIIWRITPGRAERAILYSPATKILPVVMCRRVRPPRVTTKISWYSFSLCQVVYTCADYRANFIVCVCLCLCAQMIRIEAWRLSDVAVFVGCYLEKYLFIFLEVFTILSLLGPSTFCVNRHTFLLLTFRRFRVIELEFIKVNS